VTKASDVLTAELIEQLRHNAQTQTEILERLGGQVVNHILEGGKFTFDTSAVFQRDFPTAIGSVTVSNIGANTVTIASGQAAGSAPTSGIGVYDVPAGAVRTYPIGGHTVTFYGTNGQAFCYVISTAAIQPVAG
jgi:hypothetical protein